MPTLPPLGQLADHLLPGGLAAFIDQRRPDTPWHRIARDLWQATDSRIDVSHQTVISWAEALGFDTGRQVAS